VKVVNPVTLDSMANTVSPWLDGSGRHARSVISSRVRLARNLADLPFAHRAGPEDLKRALSIIKEALGSTGTLKTATFMLMSDLDDVDRQFLVERHLISQEHAERSPARAVAVGDHEMLSVMVNEEDHLRLQSIQSGFQVMDAWRLVDRLDDELDGAIDYAFSYEWGYLSACPTNTGTGLRASVLVHLPALVLTGQINKVVHGISQMGLAVRGFYGEGSDVMGNLFQISNRTALGTSEIDIIQSLEKVVGRVLEYESRAREILLRDARAQIEDKVWRAYGILKYCRKVTSQDVMSLTSAVRLGLGLGMIDSISVAGLNSMVFASQPAHLQKKHRREMGPAERDVLRAEMVRRILAEEEARTGAG
jgi:protein arginine kinase